MSRRVVLLHDAYAASGRADAQDVLVEAEHVAKGLQALGYDTLTLPVGLDLAALETRLAEIAPHVVFNLMESIEGRGRLIHVVPALLESLGLPFTGCSGLAQWLTSNKLAAKRHLAAAGIATPEAYTGDAAEGQWIVKSAWEHASIGIDDASVVTGATAIRGAIARRKRELGGEWFAERYIDGREVDVALLADGVRVEALPVSEISFDAFPAGKPRIVGYAAKWESQSFEYRSTIPRFDVEAPLAAAVTQVALACWKLFDLSGYARVDFRVDAEGRAWVLEINANPCLAADAGFAAMLTAAQIAFPDALRRLVDDALARRRAMPGSRGARS